MKYTVVVADDEEEIRRSLVRRVKWEEIGFEVVGEAENGADALELVEKLEPDLLLTDIKMPFLSGIELARAVREVRPMVQIAFLSGFDDFTYAQQAIQYNIVSYMLKPISAKEIEAELIKIKKAMDQRVEEFTKERKEKLDIRKTQFLIPLLLDSFQNERVSEEALLERAEECELIRNPKPDNMQYVVLVTGIRDANGKDQTSYSSVNAVDMILKKYVHYVSCQHGTTHGRALFTLNHIHLQIQNVGDHFLPQRALRSSAADLGPFQMDPQRFCHLQRISQGKCYTFQYCLGHIGS